MKKQLAALAAAVLALGCRTPAWAWGGQQVVTLRGDGLRRLDAAALERQLGAPFEALAVTLPPRGAVLYLDGEPLAWGRALSREQVGRVYLFSGESRVSLGVLPLSQDAGAGRARPRIRCINPVFTGDTMIES